jgi:hypothetical protein
MTNPSPMTAHAGACARGRQHALPPLQWWRGKQAPDLPQEVAIAELRTALARIAVLDLTDQRAAVEGDDVAAVRIALRIANKSDVPRWLLDWAAAALLLSTMQGSLAAAVTLVHLRRRHGVASTANDGRA